MHTGYTHFRGLQRWQGGAHTAHILQLDTDLGNQGSQGPYKTNLYSTKASIKTLEVLKTCRLAGLQVGSHSSLIHNQSLFSSVFTDKSDEFGVEEGPEAGQLVRQLTSESLVLGVFYTLILPCLRAAATRDGGSRVPHTLVPPAVVGAAVRRTFPSKTILHPLGKASFTLRQKDPDKRWHIASACYPDKGSGPEAQESERT